MIATLVSLIYPRGVGDCNIVLVKYLLCSVVTYLSISFHFIFFFGFLCICVINFYDAFAFFYWFELKTK